MNRYTAVSILCCVVLLGIGFSGFLPSLLPVMKSGARMVHILPPLPPPPPPPPPPLPPPPPPPPPAPNERMSCASRVKNLTLAYGALSRLKDGLEEENAILQELYSRSYDENFRLRSEKGTSPKELIQSSATCISALGGIVAIILGVRKERRDSKPKRRK